MNINAYATWKNAPRIKHSPASNHSACVSNAERAGEMHRQAVARLHQLPVGDPQMAQARMDCHRLYHEQRGWQQAAAWWRKQVGEADRRLPPEREIGADDDDELAASAADQNIPF